MLVMFDGQNVFGDEGSFAGGWHAHEAVDKLPRTVHRPTIVAVDNGGARRNAELSSELGAFLRFIVGEVLPAVTARTGLVPAPHETAIGGSSLGGTAALSAVLRYPQVFGAAMCVSPSLWLGRGALFRELAQAPAAPRRVYLDVGGRERGQMPALAARMAHELRHLGLDESRLLWRPDARGTHNERHWRRRLPKALRFLFRSTRSRPG